MSNDIVVAIEKLIEERFQFDEGRVSQLDDNEVLLEDAVSEVLDSFDIQFSVENMWIFESPGYDTGVVVVAWIDKEGKLDTYTIQWEAM